MNLFGITIGRQTPNTRIAGSIKNSNNTSKIKGGNRKEIGDTGTSIFEGIINEEHNTKLSGTEGITVYDKMRKADGTVKATLLVTSLPIRRAKWFIQPGSDNKQDQEIKEFIENALFDSMTMTWDDILRQALLMMPFGVMVFEKVFEVREYNNKLMIAWRKLAPRMPKSIQSWKMENGKDGIQQMKQDGENANIPINKLLIFVNDREGENWWGNSILRPAYKHWYMKDNFYKIDAIAFERQGLGVPKVKLPENYNSDDEAKAKEIAKNLRAHEQAYILEPDGYEVEFMDMKGSSTRDPNNSIQHHNREIVKSVLAQFLELGAGKSGSRALSSDQTDLFLQSLEAVANNIKDVLNKYAIKQLVDLNFNNIKKYPTLEYVGISRINVNEITTAYQRVVQTGGLKPGENDEQYFRELLGLPEREKEPENEPAKPNRNTKKDPDAKDKEKSEKDKKKEEDKNKKTKEDLGLSEILLKKKHEIRDAIESKMMGMSVAEQLNYVNESLDFIENVSEELRAEPFYQHACAILSEHKKDLNRDIFKESNDFKSWRKMTFAEKKVNFDSIEKTLNKLETEYTKNAGKIIVTAKRKYLKELNEALRAKNTAKVKSLRIAFDKEYRQILKNSMTKAYEYGKANASREMGVKTPAHSKEIMQVIDLQSDMIVAQHGDQMVFEAKKTMVGQLEKKVGITTTIKMTDKKITKLAKKLLRDTSGIIMAGHINNGRKDVFDKYAVKIYALQRSELLDRKTCNFCLSMDARIVKKSDRMAKWGPFHSFCRGIWVEILHDETEKPKISGVPQSLRKRLDDSINELRQPNKPQVKKNSAANKAIQKGKAGPEAKRKASELLRIKQYDCDECSCGYSHDNKNML